MEAEHYRSPSTSPQRLDRRADVVTIHMLIPRDQRAAAAPALAWWHHPGSIKAIPLSAAALIAVATWLVSSVPAVGTLILGVQVLAGVPRVMPKLGGESSHIQIMNIRR
jgi:hypothetical protein